MASKLTVNRSTTYVITHTYQKDGVNNATGQKLFFTVKSTEFDTDLTDATALISKTVTMSGATNTITINPTDTQALTPGTYFYDLKVLDPTGTYKVDEGKFILTASPTNRLT